MVFGGVGVERLQLNEDSLWSGGPSDWNNAAARDGAARDPRPGGRRPVRRGRRGGQADDGALHAVLPAARRPARGPRPRRSRPRVRARARPGDGRGHRPLHARAGDLHAQCRSPVIPIRCVAMRLACDRPGLLRFTARLSSPLHAAHARGAATRSCCAGRAPSHVEPNYEDVADPVRYADDRGLHFEARLVIVTDGRVTGRRERAAGDRRVAGDAARGDGDQLRRARRGLASPTDAIPAPMTSAQLAAARAHTWEALRARQRDDHARLMSRVTIDLGASHAGSDVASARPAPGRRPVRRPDARDAAVPVRPVSPHRLQPSRHAAGQPAGTVERPGARPLEQQLHGQHQHRDELLAGRAGQPRRMPRAVAGDGRRARARRARQRRASTTAPAAGRRTTTRTCGGRPRRSAASAKAIRCGPRGRWAARGCRSTSGSTTRSAAMPPGCGQTAYPLMQRRGAVRARPAGDRSPTATCRRRRRHRPSTSSACPTAGTPPSTPAARWTSAITWDVCTNVLQAAHGARHQRCRHRTHRRGPAASASLSHRRQRRAAGMGRGSAAAGSAPSAPLAPVRAASRPADHADVLAGVVHGGTQGARTPR